LLRSLNVASEVDITARDGLRWSRAAGKSGRGCKSMQAKANQAPQYQTLQSSAELGWSTVQAELRTYGRSEGIDPVARKAKIAIVLGGSSKGTASYRMGGDWRSAQLTPGRIWLKPNGGQYDEYRIASSSVQVLDLYLPETLFAQLSVDYNLPAAADRFVRYEGGVQDKVINEIGLSLFEEMMKPTSAGRMLAETSSLLLAARLVQAQLDADFARRPSQSRHPLDDRRLRRILDYIEQHLTDDIAVADLARVACLSVFYFTRAFSAAMGVPPHRYVSQRRLEHAKEMIATGRASIAETAFTCRFSSQSSFTRAFRRATGVTPATYRRDRGS
jgi:AraC family transcriptional regulator